MYRHFSSYVSRYVCVYVSRNLFALSSLYPLDFAIMKDYYDDYNELIQTIFL